MGGGGAGVGLFEGFLRGSIRDLGFGGLQGRLVFSPGGFIAFDRAP